MSTARYMHLSAAARLLDSRCPDLTNPHAPRLDDPQPMLGPLRPEHGYQQAQQGQYAIATTERFIEHRVALPATRSKNASALDRHVLVNFATHSPTLGPQRQHPFLREFRRVRQCSLDRLVREGGIAADDLLWRESVR